MKAYTDIEQSKKLAEILPVESADMWWTWFSNPLDDVNGGEYEKEPLLHEPVCSPEKTIHCWSLAALLNYLREIDLFPEINANEFMVTMGIDYYEGSLLAPVHNIRVQSENFIDACVEMIIKLHEQKLL